MFDDVIILHAGQVAYHGPAKELARHFDTLGFPCPEKFNPADHVMFLMQKESEEKIIGIKNGWTSSKLYSDMSDHLNNLQQQSNSRASSASFAAPSDTKKPGFFRQLRVLTAREVRGTFRNKGILIARLGMTVFLSGLYGWLFAGSASSGDGSDSPCQTKNFKTGDCTGSFQAHFGTLVSLGIMAMMGAAQPIILQFPAERPVFLREYAAHQYGVVPYFISKTIVEMPVVLASSLLTFLLTYWLMGLQGDFILLTLVAWGLGLASSSLALLVSCGVASGQKAIQLAPLTLIPQMLFSGLFLPVEKIPGSLRWVRYLCPLKYAINLMTVVEFKSVKDSMDDCEDTASRAVCQRLLPGEYLQSELISNQSVKWEDWMFYLGMLASLLVGFRILATFLLWRKGKYVF